MNSRFQQFLRKEWLQLLLVALPLLGAFAALPFVRGPVPIHWNLQGQADGFVSGNWGLLLTPVIFATVILVVLLFEHFDKYQLADGNTTAHGRAVRAIRLALSFFFVALGLLQIFSALGYPPYSTKLLPTGMALLFAFIGNLFGKLKPNRYVGIRVPWTLNSENVWRQTHRIAGWLWTGGGLLFALLVWLLPHRFLSATALAWILILIILPLAVAWQSARRENSGTPG